MIRAVFLYSQDNNLKGFTISGHAGFDRYGKDIVCAAVSGAVQAVIAVIDGELGLTDCFTIGNEISCDISKLEGEKRTVSLKVLSGFEKLMEEWEKDFPQNIITEKQLI
ncbi:MAG: ribosomal-processing cysteine protease Prp [Clostridia bacterium]|nr:ribosomal-processing cysteine protease Prp [Clostridia bacterium]